MNDGRAGMRCIEPTFKLSVCRRVYALPYVLLAQVLAVFFMWYLRRLFTEQLDTNFKIFGAMSPQVDFVWHLDGQFALAPWLRLTSLNSCQSLWATESGSIL